MSENNNNNNNNTIKILIAIIISLSMVIVFSGIFYILNMQSKIAKTRRAIKTTITNSKYTCC